MSDSTSPPKIVVSKPAGWFVNLEQELGTGSQQGSNDPPGPIGVQSKARPSRIDESAIEKDSNEQPGLIVTGMQSTEEANQDEEMEEPEETENAQHPMAIFAEHVTIAGLEEAYTSPTSTGKIMFRMALMASFAMIIYEAIMISDQYLEMGTAVNLLPANDITAPFPNISICFQPMLNDSYLSQMMIIPDKIRPIMHANNITEDEISNYIKNTFSQLRGWSLDEMNSAIYKIARKVGTLTVHSMVERGDNLLKLMSSDCPAVLSNCSLYGQPFDCCSIAQFISIAQLSCFRLNMNAIDIYGMSNILRPDPLRLHTAGFKVDVSIDWTDAIEVDGGVSDGFQIFVDKWPGQHEAPISVPAGMDALITIAEPKRISEQTECFPPDEVPKMKYFDHYDPYGTLCSVEMGTAAIAFLLNCQIPIYSYMPSNYCTFDHIVLIGLFFTDTDVAKLMELCHDEERVKALLAEAVRVLAIIANPKTTQCKPLCNRWQYKTIAASYGRIDYRADNVESHQSSNISWSRINVYMPQSAWNHKEEKRSYAYMAFCDIGGMMGVYAGFSMITFMQVIFYGTFVLMWYMKRRRGHVIMQVPIRW